MTTQQLQDLDAFRNEVRQAEFTLFDLRAKLRVLSNPVFESAIKKMKRMGENDETADKLIEFGGLLESAMSDLEEVIDGTEMLIRKNSSHAKPA